MNLWARLTDCTTRKIIQYSIITVVIVVVTGTTTYLKLD